MAEAMKDLFNPEMVIKTAAVLAQHDPSFKRAEFEAIADQLLPLEMKERMALIHDTLEDCLTSDNDALYDIVLKSLHPNEDFEDFEGYDLDEGLSGWVIWPFSDMVAMRFLNDPARGLELMKECTKRFSVEFGLRFFLRDHFDETLKIITPWVHDKNQHVRRLVSEGSRPRLPWAIQLKQLMKDPRPILPLLEVLKDDEEEYVRRSVANHFNDIAKDNPDIVTEVFARWMETLPSDKKKAKNRERLIRHGCRTLFKAGNPEAMAIFGYLALPDDVQVQVTVKTPSLQLGENFEFDVVISGAKPGQKLMIDFALHFMKANGKTAPKVFKWSDTTADRSGRFVGKKSHPVKAITTRKYYAGPQMMQLIINGQAMDMHDWHLSIDTD